MIRAPRWAPLYQNYKVELPFIFSLRPAVDLQNCGLTDESAVNALQTLNSNTTMVILDLRMNEISTELLSKVRTALRQNEQGFVGLVSQPRARFNLLTRKNFKTREKASMCSWKSRSIKKLQKLRPFCILTSVPTDLLNTAFSASDPFFYLAW